MKTSHSKLLILSLFFAITILLTSCQINFITDIKSDGSGMYSQEIGFQGDEASMAGLSAGDEGFCADQNQTTPPGTTIRQETRNENETWCIYETQFKSLDDLKSIYDATETGINDISLTDGKITYDITLDLSGDNQPPMGADIYWIVTLPGKIIENNAAEQNGNTLKWKLLIGQANNIRVVSEVKNNLLMYILGGGAFLCLCCFVPLVVAGAVFFLIRRKKNTQATAQ